MATQKISKKDLEALGIRLSLGDQKDPDGVGFFFCSPYSLLFSSSLFQGFVPWRSAWYIAGDLENFMSLVDGSVSCLSLSLALSLSLSVGWFIHKVKELARAEPFQVQLFPHIGVDAVANAWDDLTYEHYRPFCLAGYRGCESGS